MQKPSSKTPMIVLGILIVGGILAYFYFTGTPKDDTGTLSAPGASTDADVAGARVLSLLNQISGLNIDTKFFKTAMYASLVDHTVPIYPQNVGKSNPFYNPTPAPKAKTK